jgi:hypothetical protein
MQSTEQEALASFIIFHWLQSNANANANGYFPLSPSSYAPLPSQWHTALHSTWP